MLTGTRNKRHSAFTLVELLVAMAVIAILMSLLMPTLSAVRRQVNIAKGESLIQGISTALDEYNQMHGVYPPNRSTNIHGNLDLSAECLVYYLSGADISYDPNNVPTGYRWTHPVFQDTTSSGSGRRAAPIHYEFHHSDLMDGDEDKIPELKGPFGKRVIYNPVGATDGHTNQFGQPRYRLGTFDLFFAGPDGKYDTSDDITIYGGTTTGRYEGVELK